MAAERHQHAARSRRPGTVVVDALVPVRTPPSSQIPPSTATGAAMPGVAFKKSGDVNKERDTIRRFFPAVCVKGATPGIGFHPDQLVFLKAG